MKLIYKENEKETVIGEIYTNRCMSVEQVLEQLDINMNKFAKEQGWDGYNHNCIDLVS